MIGHCSCRDLFSSCTRLVRTPRSQMLGEAKYIWVRIRTKFFTKQRSVPLGLLDSTTRVARTVQCLHQPQHHA